MKPRDEREGCPSASAMERLSLCPGSNRLIQQLGVVSKPTPWSDEGNKIDRYIEDVISKRPPRVTLTKESHDLAIKILGHIDQVEAYAKTMTTPDEVVTVASEVRLWAKTAVGGYRFSGRADVAIRLNQRWALIIDNKSGWYEVIEADGNLQLRTLAVAAFQAWSVPNVVVAIVQPNLGKPSMAYYDTHALLLASEEIGQIVQAAASPHAELHPSPRACRFCPARPSCPAIAQLMGDLSTNFIPRDWSVALDQCEIVQMVVDDLRAQAKKLLLHDPQAIRGWHLSSNPSRANIKDAHAAAQALEGAISLPDFLSSCCSVSWPSLQKAYAASSDVPITEKTAERNLKELLEGNLEYKPVSPSLKRDAVTLTEELPDAQAKETQDAAKV